MSATLSLADDYIIDNKARNEERKKDSTGTLVDSSTSVAERCEMTDTQTTRSSSSSSSSSRARVLHQWSSILPHFDPMRRETN